MAPQDTPQGKLAFEFATALVMRDFQRAHRMLSQSAQADWPAPIVTTIEPVADWYPAEDYHQSYWDGEGQRNPYCMAVIPPKLAKLRKGFADRLRAE